MNEFLDKIEEEIRGEILLFGDKEKFSNEEKCTIIKGIGTRMEKDVYYKFLVCSYLPKINQILVSFVSDEDLSDYVYTIFQNRSEINNGVASAETFLYANYFARSNLGYSLSDFYPNVIENRIMDVKEIKSTYEEGNAYEKFSNNTDFLITNNLLLTRYPDFYEESDLKQLWEIASSMNRHEFKKAKKYNEFKKAAKVTRSHIKNLEKGKSYIKNNKI